MDTKALILIASIIFANTANAAITVGVVKLNDDGHNYLFTPNKITAGDTVRFQFPNRDRPVCCKSWEGKGVVLAKSDPDAVDSSSEKPLYRYELGPKAVSSELPFVGIAVIGKGLSVQQSGKWQLKVRDGSASQTIGLCTSSEGVHVTSRAAGETLRDLYLYLGYEIENPTCDTRREH